MKGIVVGATGSIGKQIVKDLTSKNIFVASIGRNKKKLINLTQDNNLTKGYLCDIIDKKKCKLIIEKIFKDLKKIDFIIFAHGIGGITPIEKIDEAIWDNMFDVNLKFTFFFAQEIIKIMKKQQCGKILFISSIHGKKTYEHRLVYAATKSSIDSMTRSMSIDLAKHNISVNSVAPGQLMTNVQKNMIKKNSKMKLFFDNIKNTTPTKKFTTVDDVSEVITQLIIMKNHQFTGMVIYVDGGITNII